MNFKIFLVFLSMHALSYGCDLKRLDYEADTLYQKIISRIPSDAERIKQSLCFIEDSSKIEERYKNSNYFDIF